jgi:hypothetical protein
MSNANCADRPVERVSRKGCRLCLKAADWVNALAVWRRRKTIIRCGGHQTAKARADELAALAREKGALVWEPQGVARQGFVLA